MHEMESFAGDAANQPLAPAVAGTSSLGEKVQHDAQAANESPSQLLTAHTATPRPAVSSDDKSDSGADNYVKDETYPEGGLEAWLVVLGAWCGLFASLGLMNAIGTLQSYVAEHQLSDYNEGAIGWIFSIFTAVSFSCGVYIGPMFDKYGPRWLLASGSLFLVAGLMATSVCTRKLFGQQPY